MLKRIEICFLRSGTAKMADFGLSGIAKQKETLFVLPWMRMEANSLTTLGCISENSVFLLEIRWVGYRITQAAGLSCLACIAPPKVLGLAKTEATNE